METPTMIIKKKLKAENLTITKAAKMLGVVRTTLSLLVNTNSNLSIRMALELERVFKLDARELLIMQLDEQIREEFTEGNHEIRELENKH